jgi:hypothetical protein
MKRLARHRLVTALLLALLSVPLQAQTSGEETTGCEGSVKTEIGDEPTELKVTCKDPTKIDTCEVTVKIG